MTKQSCKAMAVLAFPMSDEIAAHASRARNDTDNLPRNDRVITYPQWQPAYHLLTVDY
jgi:hypothetical protein